MVPSKKQLSYTQKAYGQIHSSYTQQNLWNFI